MSTRTYAYLRVVLACILTAVYGALYGASLETKWAHPSAAALILAVVTTVLCGYCVIKPPLRRLPTSLDSLIFLFMVLACLGIPLTILFYPTCGALNEARAKHVLHQRLKRIGLAMHTYHDLERHLPTSAIYSKDGEPLLSWRVALLPYLGHEDLYRRFKLDEPWDSPHNLALADQIPEIYALPRYVDNRGEQNTTFFQVYVGPGAAFEGKVGINLRDFSDGSSNTVLVVVAQELVLWTKPMDLEFRPGGPVTRPRIPPSFGGSPMLFADGSVRYMPDSCTDDELRAVITRNGGEPPPKCLD